MRLLFFTPSLLFFNSALAFPSLQNQKRASAPFTSQFPYLGAANGLPATSTTGGILVPAAGDTAHQYTAPGSADQRGPCPALNAAANHNFISHDGITTYTELVNTLQNVFNFGWDLSVFLATLAIAEDGDITTGKLSIGTDATGKTSLLGLGLLGAETGLAGHNVSLSDFSMT
jgi:hypothetical protein